jgi:NADH-quinone oxidoreductase subunit E
MNELNILLATAADATRARMTELLEGEGYAVTAFGLASDLVTALGERGCDLVIASDDLPDAGVLELTVQIHGHAARPPIIALAEHPSIREAVEAVKGGAHDYLGISLTDSELLDAVAGALEMKLELLEEKRRIKERRLVSFEDLKSLEVIDSIMERHEFRESKLVGILQDVQKELRYLPQDALRHVAERLGVPLPRVYSVATFYRAFSLKPRGRHIIKVCVGTACHVRGAPKVLEEFERTLGVRAGETTYDFEYTLLTVNCLGCCALGPVVVIDEEYHSVKPWQAESLLATLRPGQGAAGEGVRVTNRDHAR